MDPEILTQCHMMLHQTAAMQSVPVVYIMNKATHQHVTTLAKERVKSHLSVLQRLAFKAGKKQILLQVLYGVPIVENEHMPDGFISLHSVPNLAQMQAMQVPHMQHEPMPQQNQSAAPAAASPFVQREPLAIQEAAPADVPTIQDLAQNASDRPSVSDVLMKAFDGADRVKHVAVLRVYPNGDVDASTTMGNLELSGAIQKFHVWVMHNGGM